VKFAFNLPNFGEFADPRVMAEVAVVLEAGGWDGLFIWDHLAPAFVPGRPMPAVADTTVALTAIALATNRIRFGPMIAPLPRRRVQKVAREFGSLDLLSGGRAVLGVGLGVPVDAEFEWFGEDGRDLARAQRLDESLEVLASLWRGEAVAFDGRHLHVHTPAFTPVPARVPIWVAATWPGRAGPIRRAARWDGVCPIRDDPINDFITVDDVVALRVAIGRTDEYDIVVYGGPNAVPEEFAAAGVTWWIETYFTRDDALRRAKEGPPR
jgi:alkanesulfonate monooxygenase SsuD/methylene tetrahydromethanopterin reductase-like flavin-dependent oxidoreductase (luciferase family)